jgi:hypothetical protein
MMDVSKATQGSRQREDTEASYEPPSVRVLGPVSSFTFGSMFSSNDSGTQHGGHH